MRARFLFVILFAALLFSGCKKEGELQGSVFIVTKGAENYKLGLVVVSAIPEERMRQFIETKRAYVKTQFAKLKTSQDTYEGSLAAAQKDYDEAKKSFDAVSAEKNALTAREQELNSNLNPYPDVEGLTGEDDTSGQPDEQARQKKIQQQLRAIKQQLAKHESLLTDARNKLTSAEKQLSDVKSQAAANRLKMIELLNEGALYEGVPEGVVKAVTDADGKFTIKLPATGKFAIAARSERRVFDSTEHYYWLVWTSMDGQDSKQIMLTNQNMLGQDSDDSVFNFKELIPKDAGPGNTAL